MAVVIGVVVAVVVIAAIVLAMRRSSSGGEAAGGAVTVESDRVRPAVADFHVAGEEAQVHFDVPLGESEIDQVLSDLLAREAVEVVREKRHTLPISEVTRVAALARRGDEWVEVAEVRLDTPGELPPPVVPELLQHHHDFDPFDKIDELPSQAPGLADQAGSESLGGLDLVLPGAAEASLRTQGLDPGAVSAPDAVVALMRGTGHTVSETDAHTFLAVRAGQRTLLRVVAHEAGSHPELGESEIRRFVVDFGSSGADRGLLVTEKYSPFEIYERERREPRIRFITRERLQGFVDALVLG